MDVLDLRDQCIAALAHLDVDISDGNPTRDPSDGASRVEIGRASCRERV